MSESHKFEGYKKRLQGICDENDLIYRFKHDSYPITLTICPVTVTAEQMKLFESMDESKHTSPDAAIVFAYQDGDLTYTTSETFVISDALFSKIKNLYKNMHALWLQFFFREIIQRGTVKAPDLPNIDKADGDGEAPDGSMPLEDMENDSDNVSDDKPTEDQTEEPDGEDPLVQEAISVVREKGNASIALLQRQLGIEKDKASELMNTLETIGVVGPSKGTRPRDVLPCDQAAAE
jgi:hypothetical protein